MRILHLSDTSLPDWRIEKAAISSKKKGHSVSFGGKKILCNYKPIFDSVYEITWTSRSRSKYPIYWNTIKKQMKKVIGEVKPDIIHAHNIFSAKMVSEIDTFPLVYDNHEYWSAYLKSQLEAENNFRGITKMGNIDSSRNLMVRVVRDYLKRRYIDIWSDLELELIKDIPTVTVSNTIASDLRKITKKVFLVPNFPQFKEIEWISEPKYHQSLSSVYAGVEPKGLTKSIHRNIEGFIDIFENEYLGKLSIIGWNDTPSEFVQYKGFCNRIEMYEEMQNHSIGIIPWKKHPFHQYCSPNKAYEYAHAGLVVFSTNSLKPIFDELRDNAIGFENYKEMIDQIKYFQSNTDELFSRRLKIYEFAHNNLLWEKYEKNIFDAYRLS